MAFYDIFGDWNYSALKSKKKKKTFKDALQFRPLKIRQILAKKNLETLTDSIKDYDKSKKKQIECEIIQV